MTAWRIMYFHDSAHIQIGSTADLAPGDSFVIFSPNTPTSYEAIDGAVLTHSWVRARGAFIGHLAEQLSIPTDTPIQLSSSLSPTPWLQLIHREISLGPSASLAAIQSLIQGWLSQVSRAIHSDRRIPQQIFRSRSYIEQTCTQRLTLADFAQEAGMSVSRYSAAFSEAYQTSPIRFRNRCRMERARDLLESAPMRVSEISEAVGFGDVFQFSKAFKRHFGQSPLHFRLGAGNQALG